MNEHLERHRDEVRDEVESNKEIKQTDAAERVAIAC